GQPDGISNVYEMAVGGEPRRVTNLYAGVAGITATSPALSLARETGDLVFTSYEGGQHLLYRMDADLRRTRAADDSGRLASAAAGVLPPVQPAAALADTTVAALL